MVDIGEKTATKREAVAQSRLLLDPHTLALITDGQVPKGDVFAVARVAGIQAAKKTSELIPLCHPLPLSKVGVEFKTEPTGVLDIKATASVTGKTGVEMEALVAASVAALTVYDMCKAVQKDIQITQTRLISKTGGKSGTWSNP